VVRIRLVSPDGRALPRWSPGSHIDVECGHTGISRQYSLCGDPADTGAFEIAVLREPESRGGSAWIHASLRAGDKLKVRGPRNHFRLDETCRRAIFIAGGIGVTRSAPWQGVRKNWASTTPSTIAAAAVPPWR
jgi:ferredoxin-NADP reductase